MVRTYKIVKIKQMNKKWLWIMNVFTTVACCNPECGLSIFILIELKREIFNYNIIEFGKVSLIYCSKKCADAHHAKLSESNFFEIGNLEKFHDNLWVNEFDIRKRVKNKEKPILKNTDIEIRAKALKKKLLVLRKTTEKTSMLSTEVSHFLVKELPRELKVTHKNTRIYSRRVMLKTVELFPHQFKIDKNENGILYIEFLTNNYIITNG